MRQAVFAVVVLGLVAQRVDFSDEVAPIIVTGLPGAAVGVGDLFDQRGLVVMFEAGGSAQRVGFGCQA
ncbi:hypothetical protein APX70_200039 [Pseudomonas syringae pv. maculicola]|uniref:Uncharacterized protein n=1 Tax=Pseudomonas syringae pv. maculicola TaxID=59511 RepID=A0A3M2X653_PSEYM|nr:hypothetical protein APX70_200039 [Pseudomonas syringae pv. maculicola]